MAIYIGEWRNGNMHGWGAYIFSNGDKYEGEWQMGQKHGKVFYYAGGLRRKEYWYNGHEGAENFS
jgi:hypothetical protein